MMTDDAGSPAPSGESGRWVACRRTGHFIAKGSCFALHERDGHDVWLEIDPIPLHLLEEEVEITGQQYGADLIWVKAIGPIRALS
jgi:hypothetical protein